MADDKEIELTDACIKAHHEMVVALHMYRGSTVSLEGVRAIQEASNAVQAAQDALAAYRGAPRSDVRITDLDTIPERLGIREELRAAEDNLLDKNAAVESLKVELENERFRVAVLEKELAELTAEELRCEEQFIELAMKRVKSRREAGLL